jgi:hypothetical protein
LLDTRLLDADIVVLVPSTTVGNVPGPCLKNESAFVRSVLPRAKRIQFFLHGISFYLQLSGCLLFTAILGIWKLV